MATNITTTEQAAGTGGGPGVPAVAGMQGISSVATDTTRNAAVSGAVARVVTRVAAARAPSVGSPRRLPGWFWFVALWCGGVGAAMGLGFAFKVLMNLTLFAVK
ncbi:hypothetical protein [Paraburkholderia kururiensis]|uniref:hypothetical protein n=1 Tax=Paraburkholderia kururiensis TaxID=984307 RepID=UPI0005A86A0A|nr:hypothetical protein [Paraburkholderia kururiensis]